MSTLLPKHRQEGLQKHAKATEGLKGDAIEVGVFKGGSLVIIAKALPLKLVVGFDTFDGLPVEYWHALEPHKPGDFRETQLDAAQNIMAEGVENFALTAGLFPDSAEYWNEDICFAHVDVDFHDATKKALEWIWPRLVSGGRIVIDDYGTTGCPGVKLAVNSMGVPVITETEGQGVLIKP